MPGILRFVSMLYLIFEKGISKKIEPGILRFVIMLFWIFEKGISKKIAPGILTFISMLFNLIINVIIFSIKRVIVVFRVCAYAFMGIVTFKKLLL